MDEVVVLRSRVEQVRHGNSRSLTTQQAELIMLLKQRSSDLKVRWHVSDSSPGQDDLDKANQDLKAAQEQNTKLSEAAKESNGKYNSLMRADQRTKDMAESAMKLLQADTEKLQVQKDQLKAWCTSCLAHLRRKTTSSAGV